jgi:alkylhydroperoxidase family enzyme
LTRSAQDGQITKQELAAANQEENLDGPTRAALTFAQQLTIDHHEVTKEHYDDLKRHFTPAQIVELGLFCAIQIGGVRFLQTVDVSREDLEAVERQA